MKKTQHTVAYSIVALVVAFILCAAILVVTFWNTDTTEANGISSTEPSLPVGYVIKSENNRIAVYEYGEAEPIEILEVPVSSLPNEEQEVLLEGVYVETEEELQKRLEDYTG